MEQVSRMSKDILAATTSLTIDEVRHLVDAYYIMQTDRKRYESQRSAMMQEPHSVISFLADSSRVLEGQVKLALDRYTDHHPVGGWMKGIHGIGPIIAAGMLAHIDIHKAQTAGDIWRYAGLDPTCKWEKGQKRPWNARLKTLCWNTGQVFMRNSGREDSFYGHRYRDRKTYEIARNDLGGNEAKAAELLHKFNKSTDAYKHLKAGRLPPAQIDARARRWTVKLFLSHLQTVWWWIEFGALPAKPYILTKEGHGHLVLPPNIDEELHDKLLAWKEAELT